jgi:HSP20 family protein
MARMNPWRRDLTAPLHALQGELNRLFEEYVNPSRLGPGGAPPMDLGPAAWSPAVDLYETPEELVLLIDLPGVDPSSIELSVTGNVLTLRGEKKGEMFAGGPPQLQERQLGLFSRQIGLSNEVNFENTHAEARNGVLIVRLPKKEAARPHTIKIQPK